MRRLAAVIAAFATACGHGEPLSYAPPVQPGPHAPGPPVRLTFSTLEDGAPSVGGDAIVFSRQSDDEPSIYTGLGREACIALLPLTGGTLLQSHCPARLLPATDTLVDTFLEPARSPDGSRFAFTWQRSRRVSALGYDDAWLVVAPPDRLTDSTLRHRVDYLEPGPFGRRAGVAIRLSWVGPDTVRFLAAWENIYKVKGDGAGRVTDTVFEPLALMELDLATGAQRVVPGGEGVSAYADAGDGTLWVVRGGTMLERLDPATGSRGLAGPLSGIVLDLAVVEGAIAAVVTHQQDSTIIERYDPADGSRAEVRGFPGPVKRLAPAGGRRVVAEIENGRQVFGAPSDLWLVDIP